MWLTVPGLVIFLRPRRSLWGMRFQEWASGCEHRLVCTQKRASGDEQPGVSRQGWTARNKYAEGWSWLSLPWRSLGLQGEGHKIRKVRRQLSYGGRGRVSPLCYPRMADACSLTFNLGFCSLGFPCGSAGKESAFNEGDLGSIPGLGRSPGEGKCYPLQYSGLENSQSYLRCYLLGCSPHFAPNKT